MHAMRLLESWLKRNCDFIHCARVAAVVKVVDGLVRGEKATLTQLGRSLCTGAYEKHNIKCVDRLLGNERLWGERLGIYRALAGWLLSSVERPWIVVDWSDVELGHRYLMLKAAVAVGGRAITIYEEVHPLKRYNSPKTHRRFLQRLREVLPPGCYPIIITDAGFRGPWFREVESYGWDWIGRVRNMVKYSVDGVGGWKYTKTLYYKATKKPMYLGRRWLSSKNPYGCWMHLYKSTQRPVGRPRKRRKKLPGEVKERRMGREPWLLATSLSPRRWSARRVVRAYEKRMQIEETFRDLKSHQWGYGLQYARSGSAERYENLVLLTTLAMIATWLVGMAAKSRDLMKHLQANTIKKRQVLSVFFLGRRMVKSHCLSVTKLELRNAAKTLPELINSCAQWA